MLDAHGKPGTLFDDRSIEPFGAKLMGNVNLENVEGELPGMGTAYVSPGQILLTMTAKAAGISLFSTPGSLPVEKRMRLGSIKCL